MHAKLPEYSALTAPDKYLLRCRRLESGDFDDLAFVHASVAEVAQLAARRRGCRCRASGELQSVFDVLDAEGGREHDVVLMVIVNHAPAVAHDLRACGLADRGEGGSRPRCRPRSNGHRPVQYRCCYAETIPQMTTTIAF